MKKLYEKNELTFALVWIVIYCVLQSLANPLNERHRHCIRGKRRFLRLADGRSFCLYPKEQLAETVWTLQIALFPRAGSSTMCRC